MKISVSPTPSPQSHHRESMLSKKSENEDTLVDYNIYNRQTYSCPHYFQVYFNVTFFLLLTPFRIISDGRTYKLQTYLPQKILCAILHPLICIIAVLGIRRDFNVKVRTKPALLFSLANNFSWCMYVFAFFLTFWTKDVTTVCNVPHRPHKRWEKFKSSAICAVGLILVFINHVGMTIFGPNFSSKPFLRIYSGEAMFMWFQRGNNTALNDTELTSSVQSYSLATYFFDVYMSIVIALLESYAMISSLAVLEACRSLKPYFLMKKCRDYKILLQLYCDIKEFIVKINEFNGNFLLCIYVQIIPWISGSLVDVFDNDDWTNRFYMWSYYIFYVMLLGMAAESNTKMKLFMKRILELQHEATDNRDELHFISMYLKGTTSQTGLTGGKFFMISYGFLGATISVLITYSIIMIQFRATPGKSAIIPSAFA